MASSAPVILIVPGSFAYASSYYTILDQLKEKGYEAYTSNLPSVTRQPPEEAASLSDDADHFRNIISKLADQGKDVIVLAHSYGGCVASQAVRDVLKDERQAKGLVGGVVRLVYLTALVLPEGSSLNDVQGTSPEGVFDTQDGYNRILAIEPIAQATFSDIEVEKAVDLVKHMPHHSAVSFASELTYAGYKHVPCSYIFCESDSLITPAQQQTFIDRIKTSSGRDVAVHKLNSGHVPNVSQPEKLVEVIVKIATQE